MYELLVVLNKEEIRGVRGLREEMCSVEVCVERDEMETVQCLFTDGPLNWYHLIKCDVR